MKKTLFLLGLAAVVTTNLLAGETLKIKLVTDREVVLKDAPSEVVVKIDLSAIVEKKKSQRTPLNLAVVLDHFGSMTGAKLEKNQAGRNAARGPPRARRHLLAHRLQHSRSSAANC